MAVAGINTPDMRGRSPPWPSLGPRGGPRSPSAATLHARRWAATGSEERPREAMMDMPSMEHPMAMEVVSKNTFLELRQCKKDSSVNGRSESLPPRFPQYIAETPELQAAVAAYMAQSPAMQAALSPALHAAIARSPAMQAAAAAAAAASALRSPWAQVAMSRGVAAYIVPSPSAQFAQPASATPPSRHMSIPPTPDLGCCSAGVVFGSMGQMCHMAHMAHIGHTGHMGMSKELAPPLPAMRTMPPVHTPYIPSAAYNFATCLPPAPLDSPQVVGLEGSWPCGSSRSGTEASGKVGLRQPKSAPCLSEVANAFNDLAFWSQSGIGHEARLPSPRDGCSPTLLEGSDEASDEAGSWHGEGPRKEPQVSVGSSSHGNSKCKPCAFYHKKGCDAGFGCLFCHICEPGEKKRRRQQQRTTIKLRRMRREARLAEEAEQGHVEEACAPDTSAAGLVRGFDTTDGLVGHLAAQA